MLLASGVAQAETLHQALEAAYRSNPTLTAQRAQVRAGDENVPIARAAGRRRSKPLRSIRKMS